MGTINKKNILPFIFPFLFQKEGAEILQYNRNDTQLFYPSLAIAQNPIFIPRKHTIQSYRTQNRLAKQRRKSKNT